MNYNTVNINDILTWKISDENVQILIAWLNDHATIDIAEVNTDDFNIPE